MINDSDKPSIVNIRSSNYKQRKSSVDRKPENIEKENALSTDEEDKMFDVDEKVAFSQPKK